jgi:hypothetical protein
MLKLVDNQNTQHQTPEQQPEPSVLPALPQDVLAVPQITLSAEDRADVHASTVIRRMVIILVIVVLVLTIGTWSLVTSLEKTTRKATKQSKNATTSKSSSNPLNGNGSVNSDVKYCSNVVNGSLYC